MKKIADNAMHAHVKSRPTWRFDDKINVAYHVTETIWK